VEIENSERLIPIFRTRMKARVAISIKIVIPKIIAISRIIRRSM